MSYINLPCFLKVSCCHWIISNGQLYFVMIKTSFIHNWTLLIEDFQYFYKYKHRKILFVYSIFLHSGFWMVKFVPIYTPTKSKKWSELLMGENVSVLVSLLLKLDQRSSLMPQLIPCVCIDVSENKGDSRPELLLLWLFSSTLFEIAVLAVDHNLWFLFWQLSMGFCCCFWFS